MPLMPSPLHQRPAVTLAAVALPLLASLLQSCATLPASDPSNWRACIIQPMAFAVEGDRIDVGGSRQVYLYAQWGESAYSSRSDYGSLLVEIPESLQLNQPIPILSTSDDRSRYREGADMLSYDSETIAGTLTVISASRRKLEVDLDLQATEPVLDLRERGMVPIKGRVELQAVSSIRDCY